MPLSAIVMRSDIEFQHRVYGEAALLCLPAEAMAKRVLDDRLQKKCWHQVGQAPVGDLIPDVEAIAEARLLEADIALHPCELGREWNELLVWTIQVAAHQVAEIDQHVHRAAVVLEPDQRGDGVQRVEQKVRLDLQSKRVKLRARELRLEARLPHFELPRATIGP